MFNVIKTFLMMSLTTLVGFVFLIGIIVAPAYVLLQFNINAEYALPAGLFITLNIGLTAVFLLSDKETKNV